jgi:hypothetical protein
MVHQYLVPGWFIGYNIVLQMVFAIITFLVSIFSYKISVLSEQRQPKLFSIAFRFLSIGYFIEALFNFLILFRLNENISLALKLISVTVFTTIIIYAHIILFTVGLVTLTYMTLRIKKIRAYWLLLIISILPFFFVEDPLFLYHILSTIFLSYIFIHYFSNFTHRKKANTLLVLIAFGFLLLSSIEFIFSVNMSEIYYVTGHFLELIAYLLILLNLILVQRNEKKARPPTNHS